MEKMLTQHMEAKVKSVEKLASWLDSKGVKVGKEFRRKLYFSTDYRPISTTTLESILDMCAYFKKYVASSKDYKKLILRATYTMALYQTSVFTTNRGFKTFVGNWAELKPGIEVPEFITGIVCRDGTLKLQLKQGKFLETIKKP